MPKNLTPQDQWETEFQVPLPGEPRNIGPLERLFQQLLNRTERLKNRIGAILGTNWDATPPDTIAGLANRVGALEANQGGTTLSAHRTAPVLDHPDGSVTAPKLAPGAAAGNLAQPAIYWGAANWDALTTPGWYPVTPGGSGGSGTPPPSSEQYGLLVVMQGNAPGGITQLYIPSGAPEGDPISYVRQYNGSSWSPWRIMGTRVLYATLGSTLAISGTSSYNLLSLNLPPGQWLVIGYTVLTHNASDATFHSAQARLGLSTTGSLLFSNSGIWASAHPTPWPDLRPEAHVWGLVNGPGTVTLSLSQIASNQTTYVAGGTFLLALRVA